MTLICILFDMCYKEDNKCYQNNINKVALLYWKECLLWEFLILNVCTICIES